MLEITWGRVGFQVAHGVIMPEKRDCQCEQTQKWKSDYWTKTTLSRIEDKTDKILTTWHLYILYGWFPPLVPVHQKLTRPSCQGGEKSVENLQSIFWDSDSREEEAAEEAVEVGLHCSSWFLWFLTSSPGAERSTGRLQRLYGWAWLEAGHLHNSCSLIGHCRCQWGPADCSYYGFLKNHHWGVKGNIEKCQCFLIGQWPGIFIRKVTR